MRPQLVFPDGPGEGNIAVGAVQANQKAADLVVPPKKDERQRERIRERKREREGEQEGSPWRKKDAAGNAKKGSWDRLVMNVPHGRE